MRFIELISVTAGGQHAWYKTDIGITVRKPLGQRIYTYPEVRLYKGFRWFFRFLFGFKRLFRRFKNARVKRQNSKRIS